MCLGRSLLSFHHSILPARRIVFPRLFSSHLIPVRHLNHYGLSPVRRFATMAAPPTMRDALSLLRDRFKHDNFRPGQAETISIILNDPRSPDVPENLTGRALAIFPTGAGKSLCYQLPGLLLSDGLTLVVSPLMALMKDQVDALVAKGFPAACLDSSLSALETRDLFDSIRAGELQIVFVSPERFKNDRFIRLIRSVTVGLFAVDEAHCISEWGHSFRPDYLRLSRWADRLDCHRRLALTATATPQVAEDICKAMNIPFPSCQVRTPSIRPNLTTRVTSVPPTKNTSSLRDVLRSRVDLLATRLKERPPGPTIIYVTLQATSTAVAQMLQQRGFPQAACYHAGMRQDARKQAQDTFMQNKHDAIMVATIAFGMGMDHSSIRYVYHLNMPKSLEGFIQEIGRAGRDGLPSICESLVCIDDVPTLEGFIYGETPCRSSVLSLLEGLFTDAKLGSYIDYSVYDMCFEHDIRDTCVGQILAQLDISEGIIEESTPFYSFIDLRMFPLSQRKWPPKGSLADSIIKRSLIKQINIAVDVVKVANELDFQYGQISRICDDMVNDGIIQAVSSRKLRQRALVKKLPEDLDALADRLHSALMRSQKNHIKRLHKVLQYYSAKKCQTVFLAQHLGDKLDQVGPCGHCEFCIDDEQQPVRILEEVAGREEKPLDEERWAKIRMERSLPKDNPLLIARFAAGISSPIISRKFRKFPLFGSMDDHDFNVLLRAAEKFCS